MKYGEKDSDPYPRFYGLDVSRSPADKTVIIGTGWAVYDIYRMSTKTAAEPAWFQHVWNSNELIHPPYGTPLVLRTHLVIRHGMSLGQGDFIVLDGPYAGNIVTHGIAPAGWVEDME